MSNFVEHIKQQLLKPISIAPLISLRILFGALMCYAWCWSLWKADPQIRYLEPTFFFHYYGFEWIPTPTLEHIVVAYLAWILGALGLLFGAVYRLAAALLFVSFTYLQLVDATNYINHYYAISIFALFFCFLPAEGGYSIAVWRKPEGTITHIPWWYIGIFQAQLACIYGFAALAKCHTDWLYYAMPLKIWLLQSQDFWLIGPLFAYPWVHLLVSWVGFLFDASIVVGLAWRKSRPWAYGLVVVFHTFTALLFNIGLFPWLMIVMTTCFFSADAHLHIWRKLSTITNTATAQENAEKPITTKHWIVILVALHFTIQVFLPLRHHFLYTGNPLWTEEGYRFSWWVMLVEKDGWATFFVEDPATGRQWEVNNAEFLTGFQEKRMSVRPDHIAQYAQHLAKAYQVKYQIANPVVRAAIFVTLNGRPSQQLIDPAVNLATVSWGLEQKTWVLPFKD